MGKISSLDVPVGEDEDCNMYDLLPGSGNEEEAVLDKVQHEQLCAILWPMVDSLPGQQPEQKGLRELRRPNKSNQLRYFLTEQRSYSKALQGNGVGTFNRTWTSSTERVALWEEEYQAELEKLRAGV